MKFLIDSIFPRTCPVCGDIVMPKGQLICKECITKLNFVKEPKCIKCGKQILTSTQKLCYDCAHRKHDYDENRSILNYDNVSKKIMSGIKYQNRREHADFIGRLIVWQLGDYIDSIRPDCIIPVPVHKQRQKKRGYNQAEIIADVVSDILRIPVRTDIIIRKKHTKAMKDLAFTDRFENLMGAFEVRIDSNPPHTILIIDDIYTTGATMDAISRIFKEKGIKSIYCVSACISSDI